MAATLDIKRELLAVDTKNYDFYSNLTDEERKGFSPYILMRYVSSARGDPDIQEWFVEMVNECINKNHWDLTKNHKELLWKLFAVTGVGVSTFHPYLAAGKKEKFDKIEKLLAELYPTYKLQDIKLLAKLMDEKDREELFDNMGFDKKQRKEYE
jgi:hypothetical protein